MANFTGVFASLAVAATLAAPRVAQAAQAPAGSFYQLSVTTSFEPKFTDCWAFSSNGRFIVSHGGGLGSFPYQLDGLNTQANHWQAAWQGRVSIAFAGVTTATTITGDAVDTLARTYSITGTKVGGCNGRTINPHGFQTR